MFHYLKDNIDLNRDLTFIDTGYEGSTANRAKVAIYIGSPETPMSFYLMETGSIFAPGYDRKGGVVSELERLHKGITREQLVQISHGSKQKYLMKYSPEPHRFRVAAYAALKAFEHATYEIDL